VVDSSLPSAQEPSGPCLAMRAKDAAKALGVSARTLWAWTQCGDVPHVRRGKTILYPVDALRRWLDEQVSANTGVEGRSHDSP